MLNLFVFGFPVRLWIGEIDKNTTAVQQIKKLPDIGPNQQVTCSFFFLAVLTNNRQDTNFIDLIEFDSSSPMLSIFKSKTSKAPIF